MSLHTHDVLIQEYGATGHCMLLNQFSQTSDDLLMLMNVYESTFPATNNATFYLTDALPFGKTNADEWYAVAYDFVARRNTAGKKLHPMAKWKSYYSEPQSVMCDVGYGGVYTENMNVYVSVALDVNEFTLNGHSYNVSDYLYAANLNGYNVIEVGEIVSIGANTISANGDNELFYVIDASGVSVNVSRSGDNIVVSTSDNDNVKYVHVYVKTENGSSLKATSQMCYAPNFDDNGNMIIPRTIRGTTYGDWSIPDDQNGVGFYVNVVFRTPYDTATYLVDGLGNHHI